MLYTCINIFILGMGAMGLFITMVFPNHDKSDYLICCITLSFILIAAIMAGIKLILPPPTKQMDTQCLILPLTTEKSIRT